MSNILEKTSPERFHNVGTDLTSWKPSDNVLQTLYVLAGLHHHHHHTPIPSLTWPLISKGLPFNEVAFTTSKTLEARFPAGVAP